MTRQSPLKTDRDELLVHGIDESVGNDPETLVAPQPEELFNLGKAVRRGETEPVVDAGQVTQVEDVVEFGRCWGKLFHNSAVGESWWAGGGEFDIVCLCKVLVFKKSLTMP